MNLHRYIVLQAVRDLSSGDQKLIREAESYVTGELFAKHIEIAQLPDQYLDAIQELPELSPIQRRIAAREVVVLIKKNPGGNRGQGISRF